MSKLIDLQTFPIKDVLPVLLQDKTTKKNIIWATDTYADMGQGFQENDEITDSILLEHPDLIKPRIAKAAEEQQDRTRKKAEVYTPVWLCNEMNSYLDEEWFGRKEVFNHSNPDHTWEVTQGTIIKHGDPSWQDYVDSRRLEITCGEAPFLVSRYDASTGKLILPPNKRIGLLDRKLRIVAENTYFYPEWLEWTTKAFESIYGYEYQGDNLFLARCNLLLTFEEYYKDRWNTEPDLQTLKVIANRIVWNIWQMDGFTDTVPGKKPKPRYVEESLFAETPEPYDNENEAPYCRIFNWKANKSFEFHSLKAKK